MDANLIFRTRVTICPPRQGWLLRCLDFAKENIPYPEKEVVRQRTSFIR